jgi:hypothetical protein
MRHCDLIVDEDDLVSNLKCIFECFQPTFQCIFMIPKLRVWQLLEEDPTHLLQNLYSPMVGPQCHNQCLPVDCSSSMESLVPCF